MRALVLCVALCGAAVRRSPGKRLTASARAAIEKAVLEVNAQMTRAAEDRDIDRLFSFMLANDRGSIIQSGNLFPTREEALATVKRNFPGRRRHQVPLEAATGHRDLPDHRPAGVRRGIRNPHRPGPPATFVTPFAQTVLFVLTDGKWKALHAHNSTVPR